MNTEASTSKHGAMVELRGMCPREIVDVLDAVSLARDIQRIELVNEILGEWTRKTVHVATLVARVARSNGSAAEADGRP